jgi:N utilization substance protein A
MRPEVDPDLCERLHGLYTFMYNELVEASFQRDPARVDTVIQLLEFERETWVMLMRKLDVVQWRDDIGQFIAEALGPAKVQEVKINEEEKTADVMVSEHQLSLAIGKEGQNARLAARLSGYKVDIHADQTSIPEETPATDGVVKDAAEEAEEAPAADAAPTDQEPSADATAAGDDEDVASSAGAEEVAESGDSASAADEDVSAGADEVAESGDSASAAAEDVSAVADDSDDESE